MTTKPDWAERRRRQKLVIEAARRKAAGLPPLGPEDGVYPMTPEQEVAVGAVIKALRGTFQALADQREAASKTPVVAEDRQAELAARAKARAQEIAAKRAASTERPTARKTDRGHER